MMSHFDSLGLVEVTITSKVYTVMHSCDKSRVRHGPHATSGGGRGAGGGPGDDACPGTQAPTAVLLLLVYSCNCIACLFFAAIATTRCAYL